MHHGDADTTVPINGARNTCNQAVAAGDVCELVTYAGVGHELPSVRAAEIRSSSAHFIMDKVLLSRGYYGST
jgi:predicted esterase